MCMDDDREGNAGFGGWLFLSPDAVPREWQHRAVPVSLVPLFPEEAVEILGGRGASPRIEEADLSLVQLVVRGRSAMEIARQLGVAPRTVYRRVARLRREFGVASTAELAAALAKRGF